MCFGGGQSYDPNQDVHPATGTPGDGSNVTATRSMGEKPAQYTDPANLPPVAPKIDMTGGQKVSGGLNSDGLMK